MKISVTVKPRSKKEVVEEIEDGTYLVKVNALPVDGKANARVVEMLSKYLKVPKSKFKLVSGKKAKIKVFEIL